MSLKKVNERLYRDSGITLPTEYAKFLAKNNKQVYFSDNEEFDSCILYEIDAFEAQLQTSQLGKFVVIGENIDEKYIYMNTQNSELWCSGRLFSSSFSSFFSLLER